MKDLMEHEGLLLLSFSRSKSSLIQQCSRKVLVQLELSLLSLHVERLLRRIQAEEEYSRDRSRRKGYRRED